MRGRSGAETEFGLGRRRFPPLNSGVLNDTLKVWTFNRDVAPDIATRVALDQLEVADLEVVLLSTRRDVITVQVVEGEMSNPDEVLYVSGRGLYELVRKEGWPPATAGAPPRVLLTLKAWPNA